MRHGTRHLVSDLIVLTVAAYLESMVLVRCAGSLLAAAPTMVPTEGAQTPFERARERGTVAIRTHAVAEPRCPGLSLAIVAEFADRSASLVSLRSEAEGAVRLMRIGDRIDDRELVDLISDPATGRPQAIFSGERGACEVTLFARPQTPQAKTPQTSAPPTSTTVDRALRDRLLAHPADLIAGALVVPEPGGRGLRIERLAPGSMLSMLGLAPGDRVLSVNGVDLARPEAAIRSWSALAHAERWVASIDRNGQRIELEARLP